MTKPKAPRPTQPPQQPGGDGTPGGGGPDSEELKILRQSIPKDPVTRDFLQDLLEEHRANKKGPPG